MAELSVALLGLNRVGASVGLALRRYMDKGGANTFHITGFDLNDKTLRRAEQMNVIDSGTRKAFEAVEGCDIVVVSLSYEEVRDTYKTIAPDLRDGVLILDASPLKRPSLEWAEKFLSDEHHMVGMTPIINPKYLFNPKDVTDEAVDDLFDDSAILLTPSADAVKEAVDLAFQFAQILGSKPRFLDPLEHDTLLAQMDGLPKLLGTALFYNFSQRDDWEDLQWLTNPAFGVLTRPLHDIHPDALRDTWTRNNDVMARSLDEMIATLKAFRDVLQSDSPNDIESAVAEAGEAYEIWINHRHKADWDKEAQMPDSQSGGITRALFGGKLADRFFGKDNDDK